MTRICGLVASLFLCSLAALAAEPDPCVALPPYLINIAKLQYSLENKSSSEWLDYSRKFEQNSGGSSASGNAEGFGFSLGGSSATFTANERESLLLQTGSLSSATKEQLRQEVQSVSKALEALVANCTGARRSDTVVYVEQNPDYPNRFALHITFNPEVELLETAGTVLFDQPVRCVWSTTGGGQLSAGRRRHTVPLKRPNGVLGQCVRQEAGALTILTSSPLPVLRPAVVLPRLNPIPRSRWGTTIKAHGAPSDNRLGWLDGRYTAYIRDLPNGAVTSNPVSTNSHLGYVVVVPRKGPYLVAADYTASTDRPVAIFTAPDVPHDPGMDIFGPSRAQVPFPTTASPVVPQVARVAVLDLEEGRNVIDLRAASMAGLPDIFSLTVVGLEDMPTRLPPGASTKAGTTKAKTRQ